MTGAAHDVELVGLTKVFGRLRAVDDLSLTIARGEFVSLLGPSGCGKSTVLRMIAGLAAPSAGVVRRAWDDAAIDRTASPLGCVFQEPTLMPWTSLWQNVYLPLRLRGIGRRDERRQVDESLKLVGLGPFAEAYPAELSGGMKMRASVARALVTRPKLL